MIRAASALMTSFLLGATLVPEIAHAADPEDLDNPDGHAKKPKRPRAGAGNEIIREVVRGFYAKSDVGTTLFIGRFSPTLQPGTATSLGIGQDFVDQEHSSMAWEVVVNQSVHNGLLYQLQPGNVPPESYIQGDTRVFNLMANYEYSFYPGRRVGLGLRLGGLVGFAPVLMDQQTYLDEVVTQTWDGVNPAVHRSPLFGGFGGPTFEYYTKLSHFSVGLDADVGYVVGMDLMVSVRGFLKFTFSRPTDRRRATSSEDTL
jgi:hypothetical protein